MKNSSPDYQLRLLGGASIEGPEGPVTGRPSQRNALALMAVLATAPERTLPRETIAERLWPERETKSARHLLSVTVYEIRKGLDEKPLITVNDSLRLSADVVESDVERFEVAIEAGDWGRAAAIYAGPFLEGFHANGSEAFERWVESERWRYERLYRTVLERLAEEAEDPTEAVDRWRTLLDRDPAHATAAIGLMRALEAVSRRAEAIDVAHAHRMLLLDEYGADPNPDVEALADRLREAPLANGTMEDLAGWSESGAAPDPATPSDSFDWRRSVLPSAAAAALVATFVVAVFRPAASGPERHASGIGGPAPVTLVVPFENRSGDPELEDLGTMAADWITQSLVGTGLMRLVSSEHLRQSSRALEDVSPPDDPTSRLRELAEIADADLIVSGAFYRRGDSLVFQEQILNAGTGEVLSGLDRIAGPADDPIETLERLRRRTAGRLAAVVDPRLAEWSRTASHPPSYEAYGHFTRGLDAHARGDYEEAVLAFRAAASDDAGFTAPSIWEALAYDGLMWENTTNLDFDASNRADSIIAHFAEHRDGLAPWDRAMVDYLSANWDGEFRAAYDALRQVTRLTPDPRWRIELAVHAYWLNRPGEAAWIVETVDFESASDRDLRNYLWVVVNANHRVGNFERELEVARRWRERFPRQWMAWMYELRALGALGRTREVEADLPAFLEARGGRANFLLRELEIHGHPSIARKWYERSLEMTADGSAGQPDLLRRWTHADMLYYTGRLEAARAEYEELLNQTDFSDNDVAFVGALGRIAARRGDREAALRMDRRLAETDWSEVWYPHLALTIARQRAGIAALLGERERAVRLLREAFDGAIYAEAHLRTMFPDLDLLKDEPGYRRLVRPAG